MTAVTEQIYLEYRDKICSYIRGKAENYHDAEDLTAQVFEKVYSKLDSFDETKHLFPPGSIPLPGILSRTSTEPAGSMLSTMKHTNWLIRNGTGISLKSWRMH